VSSQPGASAPQIPEGRLPEGAPVAAAAGIGLEQHARILQSDLPDVQPMPQQGHGIDLDIDAVGLHTAMAANPSGVGKANLPQRDCRPAAAALLRPHRMLSSRPVSAFTVSARICQQARDEHMRRDDNRDRCRDEREPAASASHFMRKDQLRQYGER
jgi:hypothetical protein